MFLTSAHNLKERNPWLKEAMGFENAFRFKQIRFLSASMACGQAPNLNIMILHWLNVDCDFWRKIAKHFWGLYFSLNHNHLEIHFTFLFAHVYRLKVLKNENGQINIYLRLYPYSALSTFFLCFVCFCLFACCFFGGFNIFF